MNGLKVVYGRNGSNQCCQQRKRNERNAAPIQRGHVFNDYPTILIKRKMRNFQCNLSEINGNKGTLQYNIRPMGQKMIMNGLYLLE